MTFFKSNFSDPSTNRAFTSIENELNVIKKSIPSPPSSGQFISYVSGKKNSYDVKDGEVKVILKGDANLVIRLPSEPMQGMSFLIRIFDTGGFKLDPCGLRLDDPTSGTFVTSLTTYTTHKALGWTYLGQGAEAAWVNTVRF